MTTFFNELKLVKKADLAAHSMNIFLPGMQRVLLFTNNCHLAERLARTTGELERIQQGGFLYRTFILISCSNYSVHCMYNVLVCQNRMKLSIIQSFFEINVFKIARLRLKELN